MDAIAGFHFAIHTVQVYPPCYYMCSLTSLGHYDGFGSQARLLQAHVPLPAAVKLALHSHGRVCLGAKAVLPSTLPSCCLNAA